MVATACTREDASQRQTGPAAKTKTEAVAHRNPEVQQAAASSQNSIFTQPVATEPKGTFPVSEEEQESQAVAPPLPQFNNYLVARSKIHVPPVLERGTPDWAYRTRLREADRETANFSANGVITLWGCGTQCATGAWIDRTTGRIRELPVAGEDYLELDIESRAGSNLVLATWLDGAASEPLCLFGAYVWDGKRFKSVQGYPVRAAGKCPVSYMYR